MTLTTDITLPVVHLNGSGQETLQKAYYSAYKAAKAAADALHDTNFHARDYYVVDGAWEKACIERRAQMAHLLELIQYLRAHVEHLF